MKTTIGDLGKLTAGEIRRELRKRGWRVYCGRWVSPYHKRAFQHITLSEAASLEALEAREILPAL